MSVWLVVVLVAAVVLLPVVLARRRLTHMLVARASLRHDGLGRYPRLVPTVARFVHRVRLTGLGHSASDRFDLSLIDRRPELELTAGVRVRELAPLRNVRSYLLVHPAYLEFWQRRGLRWRRVAALPREELHDLHLIEHDPDGLGAIDDVYRGSVGTVEVFVTRRLRLYFFLLVKPTARIPGPGSYPGRD